MGAEVKKFDAIVIGTGSGLEIVNGLLRKNQKSKIAVIDKDEPGGICLTRGCIPSKILVHTANVILDIRRARTFGIDADITKIDFPRVMDRMRSMVNDDVDPIRRSLTSIPNISYFHAVAEFIAPQKLSVAGKDITAPVIFLCTGSRPLIPPIEGLETTGYLTSDTLLSLTRLPPSIAIIGGGYIAAEYGHFFAAMGSAVTIIGRNPRFLHEEEPEISFVAERELQKRLTILNDHEVLRIEPGIDGKKNVVARNRPENKDVTIPTDAILIAAGRISNTDVLHPEQGGIKTDSRGWIIVNEFMETSQPGVFAFGDADGKFLFKHVANHEVAIAFFNAVLDKKIPADYHAVPHAIFTSPEIARVGIGEEEAIRLHGSDNILIGFYEYELTAKGSAMDIKNAFVKLIVEEKTHWLLGAHIVGPEGSVLIQELVTLLYSPDPSILTVTRAMHIHPSLSEVIQAACNSLMPVEHYHHMLREHGYELPPKKENSP
jgi:mycothione reductase